MRSLSGHSWRRIGAGLYQWAGLVADPWSTLAAWSRTLPADVVFAGASAAWLHGLQLVPTDPVEVVVPGSSGPRTRPGLLVHHGDLPPPDVVSIRGLRAEALHLALARLCLRGSAVDALIALDMAVRIGGADDAGLLHLPEGALGKPGMARLARLAKLAAPAESPMETRLRWLLIQAGLPQPEVQTNLQDNASRFVARADLYYPQARLVLEYDGGNHRDRLIEDDRRQNLLINAGYRILRFTASDLQNPNLVVAQVRSALAPHYVRIAQNRRNPREERTVLRKTNRILGALRTAAVTARSALG
jgi:very-short-patch-repair endonuclease